MTHRRVQCYSSLRWYLSIYMMIVVTTPHAFKCKTFSSNGEFGVVWIRTRIHAIVGLVLSVAEIALELRFGALNVLVLVVVACSLAVNSNHRSNSPKTHFLTIPSSNTSLSPDPRTPQPPLNRI